MLLLIFFIFFVLLYLLTCYLCKALGHKKTSKSLRDTKEVILLAIRPAVNFRCCKAGRVPAPALIASKVSKYNSKSNDYG